MSIDDDKTQAVTVLSRGTIIGHYRIVEKIGAGGMGEVYLAEDTELNRQVALKFLSSHLCQDADCRARFKREAQAAAKLDHPNIVTVYEVGEFQGRPFFAMQHIAGQSLRELIKTKELPIDRVIELAIQICEGLHKAHQSGIVHRDVKPANILIDADGRTKILDFGLASVAGTDRLTKTGSTLGTVGYMSPEQVRGEQADHRTDIFSFGVVLYELITGRQPFKGDNDAATSRNITDQEPEPLARYKSGVGAELQRIISKALSKDKTLRYQHVDELRADLGRIGKETRIAPATHRRRWRLIAPSLVVVGLVVLALILKPWRLELSPTNETQAATNWLAVMYFDNVAEPSDSKRLGEIATNLLITGLSQSEYLRVMSSQRLYDLLKQVGKEGVKTIDRATASQIARKAEAKWMLTGSILQSEPVLVLTSQLIDVSSGGVIASQRITGNQGENIFAVIDRLTEDVKKNSSLPSAMKSEPSVNVADVTTRSQEAYRYYVEGMERLDKASWSEARRSFRKAIELDSTFASAYLRLAQCGGGALTAIAKAEQYAGRASDRERRLIRIQSQLNNSVDMQTILEEYRQYLDRYPDDKSAWLHYAAYSGSTDSSLMFANRAIALDPTYKTAYSSASFSYATLGQFDKAFAANDKFIELDHGDYYGYELRGDLFTWSGQLDSAIASYGRALSINSKEINPWAKLDIMYLFAGQFLQAESLVQAAVAAFGNPERSDWRECLVDAKIFQGEFKKALSLADECISANKLDGMESANIDLYSAKGLIFDCLGMWDSAAANARISEKLTETLKPTFADGIARPVFSSDDNYFIRWYYRAGDTTRALRLLEKWSTPAVVSSIDGAEYHWMAMGEIALARADYSRAVECFKRADSLGWGDDILYRLAQAYWESGDAPGTIAALKKLLKDYHALMWCEDYVYASAHYLLGRAYEATGDKAKAQSSYEKFLTIWKNADPGIREVNDAKVRLARLKAKS